MDTVLARQFETVSLPLLVSPEFIQADPPFAILLTSEIARTTEAIRGRRDALVHVPLLALTPRDHRSDKAPGVDEWLTDDLATDVLAARISAWRSGPNDTVDRLESIFDAHQIADLRTRFRDQLIDALPVIEMPGAETAGHRIAGIAGMLGYAKLGALWADMSAADSADLRRETRKVIFAISLGEQH